MNTKHITLVFIAAATIVASAGIIWRQHQPHAVGPVLLSAGGNVRMQEAYERALRDNGVPYSYVTADDAARVAAMFKGQRISVTLNGPESAEPGRQVILVEHTTTAAFAKAMEQYKQAVVNPASVSQASLPEKI